MALLKSIYYQISLSQVHSKLKMSSNYPQGIYLLGGSNKLNVASTLLAPTVFIPACREMQPSLEEIGKTASNPALYILYLVTAQAYTYFR